MHSVVIIGGGAASKVVSDVFASQNISIYGVTNNYLGPDYWGVFDLGDFRSESNIKILLRAGVEYFVATGDNKLRMEITTDAISLIGKPPTNAIHPTAIISRSSSMGFGNFVGPGAVINIDSDIGNGTIVNSNAVIEHDDILGNYSQVCPNATLAGRVDVGEGAFLGIGVSVIPGVSIGKWSVVAAGASVISAVAERTLVAGCPAVVKKRLT